MDGRRTGGTGRGEGLGDKCRFPKFWAVLTRMTESVDQSIGRSWAVAQAVYRAPGSHR